MKFSPTILYEDAHILAVFKPVDMLSVPAATMPEWRTLQGRVREWAIQNNKDFKPYLLNRLDRETSGIVLFGKFPRDRQALEGIFKNPSTQKTYLALVKGAPKQPHAKIGIPLEARNSNQKVSASTHYTVKEKYGPMSLLEVRIETGRQHQIRKHLMMIGHPLVRDPKYGDKNFNIAFIKATKGKALMYLHSSKMEFFHPLLKKDIKIISEPPSLDMHLRAMASKTAKPSANRKA